MTRSLHLAKGRKRKSPFATVDEAIVAIRDGRMIIVVDDEDRENEGDLTMAASAVTPEAGGVHAWRVGGRRLIIRWRGRRIPGGRGTGTVATDCRSPIGPPGTGHLGRPLPGRVPRGGC